MSLATRAARSHRLRLPRLESLEGRTLLSTAVIGLEELSTIPTIPTIELISSPTEEIIPVENDGGTALPPPPPPVLLDVPEPGPWQVSMRLPWRIAVRRMPVEIGPIEAPRIPEIERPQGGGIETANMLPMLPAMQLDGVVTPGDGITFYGLPIGPNTRTLRIASDLMTLDGESTPLQIWLNDAEGNVIDTWRLDESDRGIDLRLLAMVRPEPTTLYIGIEAIAPEDGTASPNPIAYVLIVERDSGLAQFPTPRPSTVSIPPFPGSGLVEDGVVGDRLQFIGPAMIPMIGASPGAGFVPVEASGGPGFGLSALRVDSPVPVGLGVAIARPLPTQGAATVGGLLPAGPAIRGDSEWSDRGRQVDEIADRLLIAAEAVESAESPGAAEDVATLEGRSTAPSAGVGAVPIAIASASIRGPVALAGPGGLPMLVAGLRLAWGRTMLPKEADAPLRAEELAAIEAVPVPVPAPVEPGGQEFVSVSTSTASGAAPMRPQVLRTALIGAAALTVGLLLPELTTERSSLRPRRLTPMRPWQRFRARTV